MSAPSREAVAAYVRAWTERDEGARRRLVESCFAADGRFVMRTRELRGRPALLELMRSVHADVGLREIRVVSALDVVGATFRFRAVAERIDGTIAETYETGVLDADGRIELVLTFTGPLAPA